MCNMDISALITVQIAYIQYIILYLPVYACFWHQIPALSWYSLSLLMQPRAKSHQAMTILGLQLNIKVQSD